MSSFSGRFLAALGFLCTRIGLAVSGAEADEATAPTLTAGTGAPSASEANGSRYYRTNGQEYRRIGGAWEAVDSSTSGTLVGDAVAERTSAAGVTVDGALIKDGGVTLAYLNGTPGASTAAAGTTTSDAGVLPAGTALVYPTTGADDTKGVRLHASDKVAGRMVLIGNVSNKILKVYPPSGGTINGAAADAAFSSNSGKGVILVCLSASGSGTWLAW